MQGKNEFAHYPSSGRKMGGHVVKDVFFRKSSAKWLGLGEGLTLIRIYNDSMEKRKVTASANGEEVVLELGLRGSKEGEKIMTQEEFELIKQAVGGGNPTEGVKRMMAAGFKFEQLKIEKDDRGGSL